MYVYDIWCHITTNVRHGSTQEISVKTGYFIYRQDQFFQGIR